MYTRNEVESVFNGAILLVKRGWCQFADARGFEGIPCDPLDEDAEEWSIEGALLRSAVDHDFYEIWSDGLKDIDRGLYSIIGRLLYPICGENLQTFNNLFALPVSQVIRALEQGKASLPSLGLEEDERLCGLCSEPISYREPEETLCPHCQ